MLRKSAVERNPDPAIGLWGNPMASRPLDNVRILLVEDDPIIGLDLCGVLEAAGAVVAGPVYDAAGALALLDRTSVELAVLDNIIVGGTARP